MFDRAHKDQTEIVRRKVQQTNKQTARFGACCDLESGSSTSDSSSISSNDSTHAIVVIGNQLYGPPRGLPRAIVLSFETLACDAFLSIYAGYHVQIQSNGGFMHYLGHMLDRTRLDSPLHLAVKATAINMAVLLSRKPHKVSPDKYFAEATRALRMTLDDGERSRDDDILMSVLLLDFCDTVTDHFRPLTRHDKRSHLLGAIALAEHRGTANYKNEASKAMMISMQTGIVQNSLRSRRPLPCNYHHRFKNLRMPVTSVTRLNGLAQQLTDVLSGAQQLLSSNPESDKVLALERDLLDLDRQYVEWHDTLPELFRTYVVNGSDIPECVRTMSAYQDICTVNVDMSVANMLNMWRQRRLILLHTLVNVNRTKALLGLRVGDSALDIQAAVQEIADGICHSVGFFLGNFDQSILPLLSAPLTFPFAKTKTGTIPLSAKVHSDHATGSGAWLIILPLISLYLYATPRPGVLPVKLRDGQIAWIVSQLSRLRYDDRCRIGQMIEAESGGVHLCKSPGSSTTLHSDSTCNYLAMAHHG